MNDHDIQAPEGGDKPQRERRQLLERFLEIDYTKSNQYGDAMNSFGGVNIHSDVCVPFGSQITHGTDNFVDWYTTAMEMDSNLP